MADIERLYQEMVQSNNAGPSGTRSEADAVTHDSSDEHPNYAAQIADQIDAEEGHQSGSDGTQSSILSVNSARITQSAEQVQQKSDKPSSNN